MTTETTTTAERIKQELAAATAFGDEQLAQVEAELRSAVRGLERWRHDYRAAHAWQQSAILGEVSAYLTRLPAHCRPDGLGKAQVRIAVAQSRQHHLESGQ